MARINFYIVSKIIGALLILESLFMLVPTAVSLFYGGDDLIAFLLSIASTVIAGGILFLIGKNNKEHVGKKEGYLIVATSWIFFSLFGMLPFLISGYIPSITDAYFETISGFTTTGATILTDIESLPHGLLFWRSLIQWLGGLGIVLFTLAVLPMLNSGGGLQLFNAEVTGITHDKLKPRINETANRLWALYMLLTALCALLLWAGGMTLFDAVCHSFTALATGGYSTKQASIAYWNSSFIEIVLIIFMLLASINFSLLYFALLGNFKKLFKSEEVRWLIGIIIMATAAIVIGLYASEQQYVTLGDTIRTAIFQVVAIISTTGYATADFNVWGSFFMIVVFLVMFFGGSAGCTSGGAKLIRLMVLMKNTANEFYRHLHPNAIVPVRIEDKVIDYDRVSKVLAFIFVYVLLIVVGAVIQAAMGLTFTEAFGNTLTSVSNVGPGFGNYASNFASLPIAGKWLMSFLMLVGRLELFTVLILFTPYFWKK